MRPGAARIAVLALLVALIGSSGCGGGNGDRTGGDSGLPAAGGGGTLGYALPELPPTLDPLAARGRAALTVTRQIYEPLVDRLTGPYGDAAPEPGLALTINPSADRTTWRLTLRPGVRFQDGTPFNAAAVLANTRRWSSEPQGRKLLPHLFAVDAPRPDEVRFLLDQPVPDLAGRLTDPRLGIVSPQALEPGSGEGSRFTAEPMGSGTGAFQPGPDAPDRIGLSRFAGWWGSSLGLGPSLDGVVFMLAPSPTQRLQLLDSGSAEVADPLGPTELRAVEADPLLVAVGGPVSGIGLEGSVRGIESTRTVPELSGVWLTRLTG